MLTAFRVVFLLFFCQFVVGKRTPAAAGQPWKETKPQSESLAINGSDLFIHKDTLFSLDIRQEEECEPASYHICPNFPDKCAPPGSFCCNEEFSCPDNNNCRSNGCCPNIAQTCGGKNCCASGSTCCQTGCCDPGNFCCSGGCCGDDETCCSQAGKCCVNGTFCCPQAPGCCLDGEVCCPGGCCPGGSTCAGDGECENPQEVTPTPSPTKSATSSETETETEPPETPDPPDATSSPACSAPAPTITFIYVPGLTDVLVENMCLGMNKRNKHNLDCLTYSGSAGKDAKRRAAGCVTGHCNFRTTGQSCDEYPFASTQEGGAGAQIGCVPGYQNTDQGSYLNSFRSFNNLQIGQQFGVEITNIDCSLVASIGPPRKRDEISSVGYNATVLPPASFENQTLNHVILPLGDLDAGNYSVSVLGNEAFQSFVVVDGDGEQYGQSNGTVSIGNHTLNFVLAGDAGGVGLAVYTASKNLNVTWAFNGTTTNSTASSSVSTKQMWGPNLLLWGALLGGICLWA